jgi:hypothetical protein
VTDSKEENSLQKRHVPFLTGARHQILVRRVRNRIWRIEVRKGLQPVAIRRELVKLWQKPKMQQPKGLLQKIRSLVWHSR